MDIDAQIIYRRTPYGMICDWDGPPKGIAKLYSEYVRSWSYSGSGARKIDESVYEVGKLRLRVVSTWIPELESGSDALAVMLESPHAQLYWLYREWAEWLVRGVVQVEARLRAAYCGLRMRPFPEGQKMPIAARIVDILL